jgi:predicted CXXCH cytochrome family protein
MARRQWRKEYRATEQKSSSLNSHFGYQAGLRLRDFWKLEEYALGQASFTHYPDGTAHKNRMQGNDFVQSLMYRRGVTCFSCHDVHGTDHYAQLRKPADQLCLDCHGPLSLNGPRTATVEEHTHHKKGSAGSSCIACHMPKIATTIADVKVRAHTFAFITPAMTDRFKIPNPCTTCHADKSTAWATEVLERWPERSPWRASSRDLGSNKSPAVNLDLVSFFPPTC